MAELRANFADIETAHEVKSDEYCRQISSQSKEIDNLRDKVKQSVIKNEQLKLLKNRLVISLKDL